MTKKMQNDKETQTYSPVLSSSSISFLSTLSEREQQLYYKAFREAFNNVLPVGCFAKFGGILSAYWMIDGLRIKQRLKLQELSLLTLLYYLSGSGKQLVSSSSLFPYLPFAALSYYREVARLKHKGFITRVPGHADNGKYARFKYIKLTEAGIKLIDYLHQELRQTIYNINLKAIQTGKKA